MLSLQSDNGAFNNIGCWPPFESSAYHGTTVAAMAMQAAPGWLDNLKDSDLLARVARTHNYLKTTTPPHDYGRVLLLWASTRVPGLVDSKQKKQLIKTLLSHQQADGGWSIRTFATPESWGDGSRAKKLKAEPEFQAPPSDGHQTGLALLVLRDAGLGVKNKRIRKGVAWLLKNQRESGRWWTRSLNTDSYHFITYSGSCYPLAALAKCGVLPARVEVTGAR
jgi:squalene-hopene/tetraprenyl-beta-curcumene cyclase